MDFLFVQFHSTIKLDLFQFMELNLQHVLSYNPKIKIQKGCTRNDIHSSTAFDTFLNRLVFFNKAYNEATY